MKKYFILLLLISFINVHSQIKTSHSLGCSFTKSYFSMSFSNYLYSGNLYLTARYNYDYDNVGLFGIGYNAFLGRESNLRIIPSINVLINEMSGYSPGLEIYYSGNLIDIYSQSQSLFNNLNNDIKNYTYTWNELFFNATDWFFPGVCYVHEITNNKLHDNYFALAIGTSKKDLSFYFYSFNFWSKDVLFYSCLIYKFKI